MDSSPQSYISPDPMLEALALRNKTNSNELGAKGQQNDPTEPDEQQPVTTETNLEESKPKRGRGRPRKRPIMAALDAESKPKRGRGRPRTKMEDWSSWLPTDWQSVTTETNLEESKPKRGRGRPRKRPIMAALDAESKPERGHGRPGTNLEDWSSWLPTDWQSVTNETNPEESKPKRGRGRPRKRPIMAALDVESKPKRGCKRPRTKKEDWPSWLPNDWQIVQKTRQHGSSAGHVDKYYISPHGDFGHRFRSKKDVLACICVSSAEGNDKKQHTAMVDDLFGE